MNRLKTARELLNLRQGRTDWYRIVRNQAGPAQIHLYDEIGTWGTTAADFLAELAGIDGPIEIHLSSEGGEIFDGIAIYNALQPRQPAIVVDSLAASIASVIAMAAAPGKLTMAKNSTLMIHEGFGLCGGTADDMRATADLLDKMSGTIAGIYADRTGKPAAHYRDLMKAETWFSAQEAVDEGLADQVAGSPPRAAVDVTALRNDSDGDGDVDDSAWDASKAWAAGAASDDPAAFYNGICAGKKAGDPATQDAHALPHHYHPGDPPNAAGVRNALSRLPQTHDLTNEAAAKAHLEAHMSVIGGDSEPAENSADVAELIRAALKEAL